MTAGLLGVLTGYLQLFLAIIVADDCIEDYRIGYKNILGTKRDKNKYFFDLKKLWDRKRFHHELCSSDIAIIQKDMDYLEYL